MSEDLEKKENAGDEFCTAAETSFVQRVWQDEHRKGVPAATVFAHPDGLTEVLDTDPANVDAVKKRLMEPELRVRGTTLPRPRRREVASLLERQVNALVAGRDREYRMLKEYEKLTKQMRGRKAKR